MIDKSPPFKGLNVRIPILIPTKMTGVLVIRGLHSGLGFRVWRV